MPGRIFYLSLSIKPERFADLKCLAEKHGLTALMDEEQKGDGAGRVSAHITGGKEGYLGESWDILREFFNPPIKTEQQVSGSPEKEK